MECSQKGQWHGGAPKDMLSSGAEGEVGQPAEAHKGTQEDKLSKLTKKDQLYMYQSKWSPYERKAECVLDPFHTGGVFQAL